MRDYDDRACWNRVWDASIRATFSSAKNCRTYSTAGVTDRPDRQNRGSTSPTWLARGHRQPSPGQPPLAQVLARSSFLLDRVASPDVEIPAGAVPDVLLSFREAELSP
ncbi:hypothetical protein D9R06_07925 [Kocuria marina subsp. indica]|nr:hypothetical protein B1B07_07120 [Kocuria indica]RLP57820.1 hypothetical protein D9R06_07925 [Kocuria indica]